MLSNIFLKSLRDIRRSILWWALGLFLYTLGIVLLFPSFQDIPDLNEILGEEDSVLRVLAGNVEDFGSPEGYLTAETFSLMLPLLFIVFALWLGTSWVAGEERRGSMEVLLANPIRRSSVLLQKFAAIVLANVGLAVVVLVGIFVGAVAVDMNISYWNVAQAVIGLILLGTTFAALAILLGGWIGKTGLTLGVGAVVGVLAYVGNSIAPIVDALEWVRYLSPMYYYIGGDPLTNGINLTHAGVLIVVSVVMVALASYLFERRDLAV